MNSAATASQPGTANPGRTGTSRADSAAGKGVIQWATARTVAQLLTRDGPDEVLIDARELREISDDAVSRVIDYTGLAPLDPPPGAELIGRDEWIEINLETLRATAGLIEDRLAESIRLPGVVGEASRSAVAHLAGAQAGLVLGFAARNVIGQYDMALIGEARPPRLLFVSPNLVEGRRKIGGSAESFVRWIALHEGTHAVHFGAVPWLRDYLGGLFEDLLRSTPVEFDLGRLPRLIRSALPPDPRRLISAVREFDPVRLTMGEDARGHLDRINTAMAMVEGYAEHVMDALGEELDPEVAAMREKLEHRRQNRNPIEIVLARLLGLEMKLRQYEDGKRFCDEVVALGGGGEAGVAALNRAWQSPETLPLPEELAEPRTWLERVS